MSYRIKPSEVIRTMGKYYGIKLTPSHVKMVFASIPGLEKDLTEVGEWETCCREAFVDAIAKCLMGTDWHWPLGMDSDEYTNAFFSELYPKLKAAGLLFEDEV